MITASYDEASQPRFIRRLEKYGQELNHILGEVIPGSELDPFYKINCQGNREAQRSDTT